MMDKQEAWGLVVLESQKECERHRSPHMMCALEMARGKEGCSPCRAKNAVLEVCVLGEKLKKAEGR